MVAKITFKNGQERIFVLKNIKEIEVDENKSFDLDNPKSIQPPHFVKHTFFEIDRDYYIEEVYICEDPENPDSFKIMGSENCPEELKNTATKTYVLKKTKPGGFTTCDQPNFGMRTSDIKKLKILSL